MNAFDPRHCVVAAGMAQEIELAGFAQDDHRRHDGAAARGGEDLVGAQAQPRAGPWGCGSRRPTIFTGPATRPVSSDGGSFDHPSIFADRSGDPGSPVVLDSMARRWLTGDAGGRRNRTWQVSVRDRRVGTATDGSAALSVSATLAAIISIPPAAVRTYPAPWSPGLGGGGVLTPEAGDSYTYSSSTGAMDAAALPSNTSGNLRAVFWPTHAFAKQNEQTCATWVSESTWRAQQGAVLRVHVARDGAVRAVTVTKNLWFGATQP